MKTAELRAKKVEPNRFVFSITARYSGDALFVSQPLTHIEAASYLSSFPKSGLSVYLYEQKWADKEVILAAFAEGELQAGLHWPV